jgi:hypothetical protein
MKRFVIKPGCSYLVKEKEFGKCFKQFKKLIARGVKGLCITKQKPAELKKKYGLDIKIYQLSAKKGICNINPKNATELMNRIENFASSMKRGVILFEGIDKVIENNDFINTLNLLEDINDAVMTSDSSLILALDDSKLSKKELAFLERNLEPIALR